MSFPIQCLDGVERKQKFHCTSWLSLGLHCWFRLNFYRCWLTSRRPKHPSTVSSVGEFFGSHSAVWNWSAIWNFLGWFFRIWHAIWNLSTVLFCRLFQKVKLINFILLNYYFGMSFALGWLLLAFMEKSPTLCPWAFLDFAANSSKLNIATGQSSGQSLKTRTFAAIVINGAKSSINLSQPSAPTFRGDMAYAKISERTFINTNYTHSKQASLVNFC